MEAFILEIKAKVQELSTFKDYLAERSAIHFGLDHQIDTYFNVSSGRLKLRQGNIENTLIYYHRVERKGTKESSVSLQKLQNNSEGLLDILSKIHGIKVIVEKKRSIYFIDNVKFHLDEVHDLGSFIEIEAISEEQQFTAKFLQEQLDFYVQELGILQEDMIDCSYSDLLLRQQH